jgi:hypothetical protein
MLAVACFFGGIRFEREQRRRAEEAAALAAEAAQRHAEEEKMRQIMILHQQLENMVTEPPSFERPNIPWAAAGAAVSEKTTPL